MGIQSAMNSAVSGLSANGNAMSVIGNNISNSNTTAYKANRALFSDVLAQEISSAGGNSQIGRGVNTATVDSDFSQGTFEGTSSNTDLAVDGPGLFIMGEQGSDTVKYTRDGAFNFNEQGYLVNPTGQRVQGYQVNQNGDTIGDLTNVQVNTNSSIPAQQTGLVDLSTNLNADAPVKGSTIDLDNPNASTNFATSVNVYDSLGEKHTLTTYFQKTSSSNNRWNCAITVSQNEVSGGTASTGDTNDDSNADIGTVFEGQIKFTDDGKIDYSDPGSFSLADVTGDGSNTGSLVDSDGDGNIDQVQTNTLQWNNGADTSQKVGYNLGLTQFSGQSEVVRQEQDGYASGNMVDVNVDQKGNVVANYSNGESRQEFRLGLAQFANEDGLTRAGNNLYEATQQSGQPAIGMPGSSVGTIRSNSLEQSNVDIAKQFTDMITTQRAYQANSRVISTTKDMLQEVINLTR